MLESKILTWNNLVKCGAFGPGYCCLCSQGDELIYHLMVDCGFTRGVLQVVTKEFHIAQIWYGLSLERRSFDNWRRGAYIWRELPCFVTRDILNVRNKNIFENKSCMDWRVNIKAIKHYKEFVPEKIEDMLKNIGLPLLSAFEIYEFLMMQPREGERGVGLEVSFFSTNQSAMS